MKHEVRSEQKFTPVVLEITMESQREVDAWHCLFNFSRICDAMNHQGIDVTIIRDDIPASAGAPCVFDQMRTYIAP